LRRLSPTLVDFLRSLNAVHSAVSQAEYSRSGKRGGVVRREPVENVHPVSFHLKYRGMLLYLVTNIEFIQVVRKHPVTGEEALYVNSQFTTKIVGLKKEESGRLRYVTNPSAACLNFPFSR
jgi:sulfonate dioxygenase